MWELSPTLRIGLFALCMASALLKGDWEERLFAGLNLVATALSVAGGMTMHRAKGMPLEIAENVCGFGLMTVVALRSDKAWPMAAAALLLLMLLTEAAQALLHATAWAYGTAQIAWELLSDAVLAGGTWRAWRRPNRRCGRTTAAAAAMAQVAVVEIDGMWALPNPLRLAIYCLVQAFGLLAGEREERIAAAANLLGSVILLTGSPYYGSNVPLELGLDVCFFGLSIVIALRTDKIWPLPFASLMLLALLTDVAQMLEHVQRWAFGTAQVVWELSGELVLAWGTWRARLRRRRRERRATTGAPAAEAA